jgi:hypothetical protein
VLRVLGERPSARRTAGVTGTPRREVPTTHHGPPLDLAHDVFKTRPETVDGGTREPNVVGGVRDEDDGRGPVADEVTADGSHEVIRPVAVNAVCSIDPKDHAQFATVSDRDDDDAVARGETKERGNGGEKRAGADKGA